MRDGGRRGSRAGLLRSAVRRRDRAGLHSTPRRGRHGPACSRFHAGGHAGDNDWFRAAAGAQRGEARSEPRAQGRARHSRPAAERTPAPPGDDRDGARRRSPGGCRAPGLELRAPDDGRRRLRPEQPAGDQYQSAAQLLPRRYGASGLLRPSDRAARSGAGCRGGDGREPAAVPAGQHSRGDSGRDDRCPRGGR